MRIKPSVVERKNKCNYITRFKFCLSQYSPALPLINMIKFCFVVHIFIVCISKDLLPHPKFRVLWLDEGKELRAKSSTEEISR